MAKGTEDPREQMISIQQSSADELAKPHGKNVKNNIVESMNDRSNRIKSKQPNHHL